MTEATHFPASTYVLPAARFAWIVLAALGIAHVYLYLTYLYDSYRTPISPLYGIGAAADGLVGYFTVLTVLSMLIFYGVSAFLIWGRGHERISIIVSLFLIALGSSPVDTYTPVDYIDALASQPYLLITGPILGTVAWSGFMLFAALFPDGRLISRRAAIWTVYSIVVTVWWNAVPPGSPLFFDNLPPTIFALISVSLLVTVVYVQVYRYRRVSNALQQQQTKWVLYGIVVIVVFILIYFGQQLLLDLDRAGVQPVLFEVLRGISGFSLVLIPITMMIAIMQYRLWDIDLIIRRTLGYAAITLLLGAIYFGGVILLQTIFTRITGGESPLAVVASTLLIAALFNPLRTRVQAFVDRRFYRQKYDTQQTLERFGDIARDEVNLEQIEQALVSTVNDTMQPEHVSLWLHESN